MTWCCSKGKKSVSEVKWKERKGPEFEIFVRVEVVHFPPSPTTENRPPTSTMASMDDYDEFGNYIGADLDSDDDDEAPQIPSFGQPSGSAAPLEGYDEDISMQGPEEGALMEIDGACTL